ncbi:hypothetical protein KY330_04920 [Candidatus Woesearchaeota archaeon]|nr:hypothetical protein [Candidatus Woesearchaeota archaeon]
MSYKDFYTINTKVGNHDRPGAAEAFITEHSLESLLEEAIPHIKKHFPHSDAFIELQPNWDYEGHTLLIYIEAVEGHPEYLVEDNMNRLDNFDREWYTDVEPERKKDTCFNLFFPE